MTSYDLRLRLKSYNPSSLLHELEVLEKNTGSLSFFFQLKMGPLITIV